MSRQRVLGAVLALLTIVVIPLLINNVTGSSFIPAWLAWVLLAICAPIAVALTVSLIPNIASPLPHPSSRSSRGSGFNKRTHVGRSIWIGVVTVFGFVASPVLCLLGPSSARFGQYIIDAGFAILILSVLLTANASLSDGYIKQVIRGVGMLVVAGATGILSVRFWNIPLRTHEVISSSNPDQGPLFLFSAVAVAIAGIIFIFTNDR